jgi:quinol monooxygenase YgiN
MLLNDAAIVYVATYFDIRKSSADEGRALLRKYGEGNLGQLGVLASRIVQEISRPNRFVAIEAWRDQASFEAHEQSISTAEFRANLKRIHNSPHDQRVHHAFAVSPAGTVADGAVWVVTHVDVPPPRREETEALLRLLAAESIREDGNRRFDVFQQNPPRTNHFTVCGAWKDWQAFDSHEVKPHTLAFREALGPMLGALFDERLYGPIG